MSPDGTNSTVMASSGKPQRAPAQQLPRAARPRAGFVVAGVTIGAVCGFLLSTIPARIYEADLGLVIPVSQPEGPVERADALRERIVADGVLRPVVEALRLEDDPMFGTAGVPGLDAVVARLRSRIALEASGAPGSYTLLAQADTAEKAAVLANAVADAALGRRPVAQADLPHRRANEAAGTRSESAPSIAEVLRPRVEAASEARGNAEAALAKLRSEAGGNSEAELAELRETIARLRAREASAQERARQAQGLIAASRRALESNSVDAATGVPPQLLSMATEMAALSRLAALQAQALGPQNPALAPLLGEIERIRRARLVETERWASESVASLAQARADGAAAAAERERAERRATALQARVVALRDAQVAVERARTREAALQEIAGIETASSSSTTTATLPTVTAAAPASVVPAAISPRGSALIGTVVRRAVPPDRPIHPPVLAIVLMASLAGGAFGAFAGLRRNQPAA